MVGTSRWTPAGMEAMNRTWPGRGRSGRLAKRIRAAILEEAWDDEIGAITEHLAGRHAWPRWQAPWDQPE